MSGSIDPSCVIPLSEMKGDSDKDTELLGRMAVDAEAFMIAFNWCMGVKERYFGFGIGGVIGVFLFRIIPAQEGIDEYLWVLVGDLPPAYIVAEENRTPPEALLAYISEMREWVEAVENGRSVEELIPVNAPANPDTALRLKNRLAFLESNILPLMPC